MKFAINCRTCLFNVKNTVYVFCPGSVCRIIISVKTKTSTDKSAMTPVRLKPAAPQS